MLRSESVHVQSQETSCTCRFGRLPKTYGVSMRHKCKPHHALQGLSVCSLLLIPFCASLRGIQPTPTFGVSIILLHLALCLCLKKSADVSERGGEKENIWFELPIVFFLKVRVGWLRWVGKNIVTWFKVLKMTNT